MLVNRFNHTSGVTAGTPTDRPKSVPIVVHSKFLVALLMMLPCFLYFSVGVGVLS